jgi:C4-dicarboxylate transporter DctM subunit
MAFAAISLLIVLLISMIMGIPIAWSLGLSSIVAILIDGNIPLGLVTQRLFTGADTFALLAIPFFILAGDIMSKGGLSKRLVDFAGSLVGFLSGGLALVSIVSCTFFAAISGSSVATTAAIGGIMYPEMVKRGYPKNFSAAVQAVGGTLGIIIPPSIVFIMYGTVTNTSIADLLMAGIIPGIITGIGLIVLCYIMAKKNNLPKDDKFEAKKLLVTFKAAILALMMPVIILGGIYAGVFTPTESAVIAVVYGLIISLFVYKEITFKELPEIFKSVAKSSANLMILVICAQLFGWLVTYFNIPQMIANGFMSIADSKIVFMICVNLLLLFTGMFMEVGATVLILGPILHPIAMQFGIDPIHFGLVVVFLLAVGQATPPFGTTLFVASGISGQPIVNIAKKIIPFVVFEFVMAIIFSFVPILSTFIPNLMK